MSSMTYRAELWSTVICHNDEVVVCTADEDGLQLPFHNDPDGLTAARRRACGNAESLVQPAVVVAITVQACQVSVPYGIEPGTAIRSTELWAKAFAQVCAVVPFPSLPVNKPVLIC